MPKALRLRVQGRVQGVGFRYWVLRQAQGLSLAGWVRNEADGSVSIHCQGLEKNVESLITRLREGPPGSRIDRLEQWELPPQPLDEDFTVEF